MKKKNRNVKSIIFIKNSPWDLLWAKYWGASRAESRVVVFDCGLFRIAPFFLDLLKARRKLKSVDEGRVTCREEGSKPWPIKGSKVVVGILFVFRHKDSLCRFDSDGYVFQSLNQIRSDLTSSHLTLSNLQVKTLTLAYLKY
jgi:hypothetical protein